MQNNKLKLIGLDKKVAMSSCFMGDEFQLFVIDKGGITQSGYT